MNNEFYNRALEKAQQKNYAGAIADFNLAIQENPNKHPLTLFTSNPTILLPLI
jgi:hypothetical protein